MHGLRSTSGWTYNVNSDFSGDLFVRAPDGREFKLPADDVLQLAASWAMAQRISAIEQTDYRALLAGAP